MNHVLTKILPTRRMILIKDHKTDQSNVLRGFYFRSMARWPFSISSLIKISIQLNISIHATKRNNQKTIYMATEVFQNCKL